jgi:FlaA1/EpsC-like NDP-sugar epimerase
VTDEALTCVTSRQLVRRVSRLAWVRSAVEAGYDTVAWVGGLLIPAGAAGPDGPRMTRAVLGGVAGIFVIVAGCGLAAGLYRRRYLRGSRDEVRAVIVAGVLSACVLMAVCVTFGGGRQVLPSSALTASFAVAAMLGGRYVAFAARLRSWPAAPTAERIIVFGAGDAGTQLIGRLCARSGAAYRPVAILDDDPLKRRLRIHGVPVLGGRAQLAAVAASTGARVLVIAIAGRSGRVIRDLTEAAEGCGLVPKVIPSVRELLTGGARIEGVRDPRISDLLGRPAASTDVAAVREYVAGKRVLVTGAGGSIGAELCRQLHKLGPAALIMLDRDESALHAVQLELEGRALLDSEETVLADIRDRRRVMEVFARARPDIVFHAAALKHLPLLEQWPAEALKTNVLGTIAVLEAAAAYGVQSFVNISTDKAASPISVLGYSKRMTERLTAYMSARAGGTYLSVRFGNVLGSRGSVLTALSAQVAAGSPVTVTDPEVSRYFMLADEAVQLVLQAAVIGRDGEVLVLDMGQPVRIADMARRLAAGYGRDVDIVFTGLRPGEKLHEDLLGPGERDLRPCHPLISQVPVPELNPGEVAGLDPDADPVTLRQVLARHACAPERGARDALDVPSQKSQEAQAGAGLRVQRAGLGRRSRMRPAELGEPRHQPVEQGRGFGVVPPRAAGRVGDVVAGGAAEQRRPVPAVVRAGQPGTERLAGSARPDPLGPPDELQEGERPRPGGRVGDHDVPQVLPGHRQHQAGLGQVPGAGPAAAVRGDLDPVAGHHRDGGRVRRRAVTAHPGRADRHRHAQPGQPPGQQRGAHHRTALVGRAQHQDAGLRALRAGPRPRLRRRGRTTRIHRYITGKYLSARVVKSAFPGPKGASSKYREIVRFLCRRMPCMARGEIVVRLPLPYTCLFPNTFGTQYSDGSSRALASASRQSEGHSS